MPLRRIFITTKDIQIITGRSYKYSRCLYHKIKRFFKKKEHQAITFREFCHYSGIRYTELEELLKPRR